jgi:glycosyltransferase involved in cell wall biosynthesis
MKIVFFVHCFFPRHFYGTETYTFELARNYKAMGFDVHVITAIFSGETPATDLIFHYEYEGIPVFAINKNKLPNTRVKDNYYQIEMRPILEKLLQSLRPDLIHVTHLINHTSVLLEVSAALRIPTFATFTDFYGFCFNNKLEASNGSLCKGPSTSRSNCIACYIKDASKSHVASRLLKGITKIKPTHLTAKIVNRVRKIPPFSNSSVNRLFEDLTARPNTLLSLYSVYNGAVTPTQFLHDAYKNNGFTVPMHTINFGVDINRDAKPIRVAGQKPIIGYIGQIAPHKGVDILVDAFLRLPKNSAELHIYGPSDQDPGYMSKLVTKSENSCVYFRGTFDKNSMAEIFSQIDLCVIPSRWYENSPLVLLNALATHTPVVVSNVSGMTEFVSEGINGHVFERGSVDDLERALIDILKVKNYLHELSYTTHYSRSTKMMAQETLEMYNAN